MTKEERDVLYDTIIDNNIQALLLMTRNLELVDEIYNKSKEEPKGVLIDTDTDIFKKRRQELENKLKRGIAR